MVRSSSRALSLVSGVTTSTLKESGQTYYPLFSVGRVMCLRHTPTELCHCLVEHSVVGEEASL